LLLFFVVGACLKSFVSVYFIVLLALTPQNQHNQRTMMRSVTLAIAILGSNRSLAGANLRGNVNDAGDADDRVLQGNSGSAAPPPFVQGEILVRFKPGASEASRGRAMAAAHASGGSKIHTAAMIDSGDEEGVVLLRTRLGVPEAVEAMMASGTVEYAESNHYYTADASSNDPYVITTVVNNQLWGMYSATATGGGGVNQYGIGATSAWASDKTDCSSVYVGLVDTGYMHTHEDLAANAGVNPGEIPGNGIDDDGNGYADDVYGWDFYNNDTTVFDGTGDAHGTHLAGIIGGQGGNAKGVAGVCWNVKILSAKVLSNNTGGTTDNIIKALDYFTHLKTRANNPLNIVATSNSYSDTTGYSQGLYEAIERTNAAGILFVASAGNNNNNNDVTPRYPSGYDCSNIIAVASIDSTGTLALTTLSTFSSYGNTTVDIAAPGSRIFSTVPVNVTSRSGKTQTVADYASYSGSSMAAAHVTGASALYAAQNPNANAAQIKAAILAGATPTTSLAGKVATGGRLSVANSLAITVAPTPPPAPTQPPTSTPTAPTQAPTSTPTRAPTQLPTRAPSRVPTSGAPTTRAPTRPTPLPTRLPTSGCAGENVQCPKQGCSTTNCCCPGFTCTGGGSGGSTCK
jgi:subtilisin family serine protease